MSHKWHSRGQGFDPPQLHQDPAHLRDSAEAQRDASATKRQRNPEQAIVLSDAEKRRFWEKVKRSDLLECWEWVGGRSAFGHGRFKASGRLLSPHRVAWVLSTGEQIPPGMAVCHRCDVPSCLNPAHLFLGTKGENNADMATKGRSARGAANGRAKLTEELVRDLRAEYAAGETSYRKMAVKYGLDKKTIERVVRRTTWRDVA